MLEQRFEFEPHCPDGLPKILLLGGGDEQNASRVSPRQSATRCRNRNASAASLDRPLQRGSPAHGPSGRTSTISRTASKSSGVFDVIRSSYMGRSLDECIRHIGIQSPFLTFDPQNDSTGWSRLVLALPMRRSVSASVCAFPVPSANPPRSGTVSSSQWDTTDWGIMLSTATGRNCQQ
jgi:hypothetical protein